MKFGVTDSGREIRGNQFRMTEIRDGQRLFSVIFYFIFMHLHLLGIHNCSNNQTPWLQARTQKNGIFQCQDKSDCVATNAKMDNDN